jgi:hypothetical protein
VIQTRAAGRRLDPQAGRLRHIAARLQGRIQPRKVGQFQGHRPDAALQQLRELDDARVVHVDLAEGDFAIQVERQDVFLTRPIGIFSSHNFRVDYAPIAN